MTDDMDFKDDGNTHGSSEEEADLLHRSKRHTRDDSGQASTEAQMVSYRDSVIGCGQSLTEKQNLSYMDSVLGQVSGSQYGFDLEDEGAVQMMTLQRNVGMNPAFLLG